MASAEVPKSIKASLFIDGKPSEATFRNLQTVIQGVKRDLNNLKIGSTDWEEKGKELDRLKNYVKNVNDELKGIKPAAEGSLTALREQLAGAEAELERLTVGTDQWNAQMRLVQMHRANVQGIENDIRGVGGAFGWLRTEIGKLGVLAAGYLGFQFITSQFQNIILSNAKLSDSLADVRRVTGLTDQEVMALNKSFKQLDTRTPIAGLRDIAIIAGKLGVAKDDVLGFTKAVDELVVALGDELGNADQITTQLGKILNVFQGQVNGDNITHLGNAIVGLANAGVASGGFLADFTQRVSGIAVSAHLSLGATLGLGASLEEMGQKAESSSTAVTRLLTDIGANLPKAAAIAKIPLEDFTKLFGETPEKALLAYAQGLVKNKTAFSEITASFKDAGEEGQRVIGTLAALGNKADFVQTKIDAGNKLLTESGEITAAFELKNETFGASVDKLGKKFSSLTANQGLTTFFQNLILWTSSGIDLFNKYAGAIGAFIKLIISGAVAYGTYNAVLLISKISLEDWAGALYKSGVLQNLLTTAQTAYNVILLVLQGRLREAKAEMLAFNIVMEANPIGVVVAGLAAIVTALVLFKNNVNDAILAEQALNKVRNTAAESIQEEKDKITELVKIISNQNEKYADRLRAIKVLRDILPDHLKGYTDEKVLAGQAAGAIQDYINKLQDRAEAEAAYDELKRLKAERLKIQQENGELSWAQIAGVMVTDVLQGSKQGTKNFEQTQKDNLINRLKANQAQIDALVSKYNKEVKDKLLNKTDDKPDADPTIVTVAERRKALTDEIQRLKVAYDQLADTDIKGQRQNQAQRDALQKQLDAIDGNDKKEKKQAEKVESVLDQSKKISEIIKSFNAGQLIEQEKANQKEIDAVGKKYDDEINKLNDFNKKIKESKVLSPQQKKEETQKHKDEIDQLAIAKQTAVNAKRAELEEKLVTKIRDLRSSLAGVYQTELDKEKDRINNFYDDQLKAGYDKDTVETARAKDLADAKIREEKRFQDEADRIDAEGAVTAAQKDKLRKAQINKKYDDEIDALKKKFSKELQATKVFQNAVDKINKNRDQELAQRTTVSEKEKWDAIKNVGIESAQNLSNAVFDIGRQNRQAEEDAQISKLEKQKDAELSNANLTEEQRTAITDKYTKLEADIKRQAWEKQHEADLQQAEVNGILAVTKAMTSAPWPLNLIAAAGAALSAGLEIAKISSMKAPEFAGGGMTDEDPAGYVGQPTVFKKSASGRAFVAGEAGREWIAPNWMVRSPRYANVIGMLERARKEKRAFADGGFSGGGSTTGTSFDYSHLVAQNQILMQQNEMLGKLASKFDDFSKKPWTFPMKTFYEADAKNKAISNKANA